VTRPRGKQRWDFRRKRLVPVSPCAAGARAEVPFSPGAFAAAPERPPVSDAKAGLYTVALLGLGGAAVVYLLSPKSGR